MNPRGPRIADFPPRSKSPRQRRACWRSAINCHEDNQAPRDEIARLKGANPKPPIKPSTLERAEQDIDKPKGKGRGKHKRRKTQNLEIHQEIGVPPAGKALRGPMLRAYLLYQYRPAHITQPLLLEQLHEGGIEISAGQINWLITAPMEAFPTEKEALLGAGLKCGDFIHLDDTGAPATSVKTAFVPTSVTSASPSLRAPTPKAAATSSSCRARAMSALPSTTKRPIRLATEGALLGAASGVNPDWVILSDEAGQFHVLIRAPCWIHAERAIRE